jgi:hypothetical protein
MARASRNKDGSEAPEPAPRKSARSVRPSRKMVQAAKTLKDSAAPRSFTLKRDTILPEQPAEQDHSIAATIRRQIMAGDYWCLARWGAHRFMAVPEMPDPKTKRSPNQGGLTFVVKCKDFGPLWRILIWLEWSDTYRVQIRKGDASLEVFYEVDDVYCDILAQVVDSICKRAHES